MTTSRLAAVTHIALSFSACTTVIVQAPADEEPTTTAAESYPEISDESSSSGEPEEPDAEGSSSTGADSSGEVGETTADESTTGEIAESTGDESSSTSSGADDLLTTSTGDESTGGSTTEDDTSSSTTDPAPVGAALGEPCGSDSDCESGVCISGELDDQPRCSTACSVDTATDCLGQGHPGLCTWGGGDQHWCTGVFDFGAQGLRLATPDPDAGFVYYQNSGFLPTAAARHAYLVLPQQVAYYVELGSVNDPGYGAVVVDVHSSDGTLVGTFEQGANPTIEPMGVNAYHWLVVRAADGKKSSYQLWLKELCWPNC